MKIFTFLLITVFYLSLFQNTNAQKPSFEWAQNGGNSSFASGNSEIMSLGDGTLFLCGDFLETAVFGDFSINSEGENDVYVALLQEQGEMEWLQSFGGSDEDFLKAAATDGNDHVYFATAFYGETHIGTETFNSMGSQDFYIAGFNKDGNFLWARHIGSLQTDYINSMDVDKEGNIVVTGKFYNDIIFGDEVLYSNGSSDFFIAKFDPFGNLIWLEQGGAGSTDDANSITTDPENNIFLTGYFYGETQLGDSVYTTTNPTGVYLAKYSSDAGFLWARIIDGDNLSNVSFVEAEKQSGVFMSGNFSGNLNLGSHTFNTGEFNTDVYAAKFSDGGEILWAVHGGGDASDDIAALAADEAGNLYISGHYLMDITFGNITLTYTLCCGSPEIYIVKITPEGQPDWGDQISGERASVCSVDINLPEHLYVSGIFYDTLNIGNFTTIEANADYNNYYASITWPGVTNINNNSNIDNLNIYPHPTREIISVELVNASQIRIYDIRGNCLSAIITNSQKSLKISVSDLPNGIYFLEACDGNSRIVSGKFIVAR
ncbi:MAG: SBBP repeat-containing protein [Bacteroidales bacterium]|nr:SBBP repeat-containing protein [Bacteroidales bacterium]